MKKAIVMLLLLAQLLAHSQTKRTRAYFNALWVPGHVLTSAEMADQNASVIFQLSDSLQRVADTTIFYTHWLKFPFGASAGKVLTSDSKGFMSWQTSSTISGLTTNFYPKAASSTSLTNGLISDDGTNIYINSDVSIFGQNSSGSSINLSNASGSEITFNSSQVVAGASNGFIALNTIAFSGGNNITVNNSAIVLDTSGVALQSNGNNQLVIDTGIIRMGDIPLFFSGTQIYLSEQHDSIDLETSKLYSKGVEIPTIIKASATLNFASTAAGASTDLTITLTGAALGNLVQLGVPNGSTLSNGVFTSWVSASNTVKVRFTNTGLTGALDPASGTFNVAIIK